MTAADHLAQAPAAASARSETAIRTHNLAKSYGALDAVWGIDLEVRDGEILVQGNTWPAGRVEK